jgi:hypothetical protein
MREILWYATQGILTQLLLPPRLTPLARMERGKTSETTIHATGPEQLVSGVQLS